MDWGQPPGSPFIPELGRAPASRSATAGPILVGSSIGVVDGPRTQPSATASVWPGRLEDPAR